MVRNLLCCSAVGFSPASFPESRKNSGYSCRKLARSGPSRSRGIPLMMGNLSPQRRQDNQPFMISVELAGAAIDPETSSSPPNGQTRSSRRDNFTEDSLCASGKISRRVSWSYPAEHFPASGPTKFGRCCDPLRVLRVIDSMIKAGAEALVERHGAVHAGARFGG